MQRVEILLKDAIKLVNLNRDYTFTLNEEEYRILSRNDLTDLFDVMYKEGFKIRDKFIGEIMKDGRIKREYHLTISRGERKNA